MLEIINDKNIGELKQVFSRYDKNGDGTIATSDLDIVLQDANAVFKDMIFEINANVINDLIDDIDPDGYGTIDFSEFLSLIVRKFRSKDPEEDLLEVFKVYDRDGDGSISAAELMEVMNKMGEEVTLEEVQDMIAEMDTSGEGTVSYVDFLRIMKESKN